MGLKSKAKFWLRQFPFILPKSMITSCEEWILSGQKERGTYFAQRGPWFKTIFPEGFVHNQSPKALGETNEKAFYNNLNYPTNKASLFYLQNTYLLGHKGLVLTADHRVFQEFSHYFGIATLKKFLLKNPFYTFTKQVKKMEGTGAVLVSPESHNYYHWLNDVLPRIRIYEPVLDQIDHFCVSSNVPAKFLNILPDFGIAKEKILLVDNNEKLHFDYLYVSSLPGSEGRSPQWAVDYLRDKLIKPGATTKTSKKIYFKRGAAAVRKVINEDAIIKLLETKGFDIIEPDSLGIYEQVDLMQRSKIVVGVHGAALSNLLFSRDESSVIEIFSPDYFRTDCYFTLANMLKLNYYYLLGTKPANAQWGDVIVDEQAIMKILEL